MPPFEDVSLFLPHPAEYRIQNMERRLNISKETAIAVLNSISWLNSNVLAALDEYMTEIEVISLGD